MENEAKTPTEIRPPLGLPNGSIRALLTLLIVAVVIAQLVRGQQVEVLWTETLMIALAHYFASRRFIKLPPEVLDRLAKEGHLELESRPLYLPRFTIRAILILAFVGVAVYLYQQDRLFRDIVNSCVWKFFQAATWGTRIPSVKSVPLSTSTRKWEPLRSLHRLAADCISL